MRRILTLALLLLVWTNMTATDSAREYFKFAKYSFDAKEYGKAIDFINKAIAVDPDYTNGLLLRAEINLELGNDFAVIVDAGKVIDIDNHATSIFSHAYLLRGIANFNVHKVDEAHDDLNHSLTFDPENDRTYFYLGLIKYQEGSLFMALEDFDEAIRFNSNNYEYYYYRAKTKIENYKPLPNTPTFENIFSDIELAIGLNPEDFRAYKLKCDMLKLNETKAREMYISELTRTIEMFPEQADFYAQRGQARILDYQFSEALADLDMAISFTGPNELILRNRALCYHNLNNYKGAIQDYTASIDLLIKKFQKHEKKGSKLMLAETLVMRGRSYQQLGNPDDACTDFYNAAKLGSKTGLNNYRRNCNIFN